jgi:hypothetical protein
MKNFLKRAWTIATESLLHPTLTSKIAQDGKVIQRYNPNQPKK